MKINNQFHVKENVQHITVPRFAHDSSQLSYETDLLSEHILDIYVNEVLTMKLTCTAQDLTELTLGRLLSEGIIRSAGDVDYLYICEYGRRAKVFLTPEHSAHPRESVYVDLTPTCCTGNQILNDDFVQKKNLEPLMPGRWTPEMVYSCAGRFLQDTPLHARTRSTHSCFLLEGENILFEAEDIGRHNAMDKVLGWALLHNVDLSSAALFTSGRVPTDMALKVIRAGVSVLITKETVTKEALELAESFGLTLIGKARPESFLVYSDGTEKEVKENRPF